MYVLIMKSLNRKTGLKRKTPLKKTAFKKRIITKASKQRRKKGIWATTTADSYFSKYVRERDGKCLKCGIKERLTCSHYHRRAISITRFCLDNCITLCSLCHAEWEGPKEPYTDFMIKRLGTEGFLNLQKKAGRFKKRTEAVAEWKDFYKSQQPLSFAEQERD